MKKKVIVIPLLLLLAGGAGAGGWYYYNQDHKEVSQNAVPADKLSSILGIPSVDSNQNRYAGVVEPQKTEGIELASGMKVKKNFVTVGMEVKVGDKLFEYDTEDAQDQITQLEIDIENAEISIESDNNQVKELEKYRDKAKEEDKLSITTQIMTTQNAIKRYEYEKKGKVAEMESLKKQIANSIVYSEFQGIVKSINKSSGDDSDASDLYGGDESGSSAYMTIMSTGAYRIKSTINEQNMMQIHIGNPVLVYSRVDESLVWKGTIQSIDKEHATSNSNSMWGSSDESMTNSSSYPFYVEMESSDGLMLGQHVYVEEDYGQNDLTGIWLGEYYFIEDEDGSLTSAVWVANEKEQLEKREVVLGEYNEELMSYEVISGLSLDDYIAFPDPSLTEGMPVILNEEIDWDDAAFEDSDMDGEAFYDDIDEEFLIDDEAEEFFDEDEEESFEDEDMDEEVFDGEEIDGEYWEEDGEEVLYMDDEEIIEEPTMKKPAMIGRRIVTDEED